MNNIDYYTTILKKISRNIEPTQATKYVQKITKDFLNENDEIREIIFNTFKLYLENTKSYYGYYQLEVFKILEYTLKDKIIGFSDKAKNLINKLYELYDKYFRNVMKFSAKNESHNIEFHDTVGLWFPEILSNKRKEYYQKIEELALNNLDAIEHVLPSNIRKKLELDLVKCQADVMWYACYKENVEKILTKHDNVNLSLEKYYENCCSKNLHSDRWQKEELLLEFRKFNGLDSNSEKVSVIPMVKHNLQQLTFVIDLKALTFTQSSLIEKNKKISEIEKVHTNNLKQSIDIDECFKRINTLFQKLDTYFAGDSLKKKDSITFSSVFSFDNSRNDHQPYFYDLDHQNALSFINSYVESRTNPTAMWEERNRIQRLFFNKLGFLYNYPELNVSLHKFETQNHVHKGFTTSSNFVHPKYHTEAINYIWKNQPHLFLLKKTIEYMTKNEARIVVVSEKRLYETLCDLMVFGWARYIPIDNIYCCTSSFKQQTIDNVMKGHYGIHSKGLIWLSENPRIMDELKQYFDMSIPKQWFTFNNLYMMRDNVRLFLFNNPDILKNQEKDFHLVEDEMPHSNSHSDWSEFPMNYHSFQFSNSRHPQPNYKHYQHTHHKSQQFHRTPFQQYSQNQTQPYNNETYYDQYQNQPRYTNVEYNDQFASYDIDHHHQQHPQPHHVHVEAQPMQKIQEYAPDDMPNENYQQPLFNQNQYVDPHVIQQNNYPNQDYQRPNRMNQQQQSHSVHQQNVYHAQPYDQVQYQNYPSQGSQGSQHAQELPYQQPMNYVQMGFDNLNNRYTHTQQNHQFSQHDMYQQKPPFHHKSQGFYAKKREPNMYHQNQQHNQGNYHYNKRKFY
eukprot:TRINITY_DN3051_c0_g2_i1.p1 TRINITY_DN3051_c0_g2~~TRINITY_DN3051_c0_g2_i1.p1  ORF type:complete len:844 (+),score=155.37 TRINITY_DN3051_c0_g2_i1:36-2567(+)